jgi:hypothetical protein
MNDKTYRILVVALLALLVVTQLVGISGFVRSPACSKSIAAASEVSTTAATALSSMSGSYATDAYTKAANVNQQIFTANEYQWLTEILIAKQSQAILGIAIACK